MNGLRYLDGPTGALTLLGLLVVGLLGLTNALWAESVPQVERPGAATIESRTATPPESPTAAPTLPSSTTRAEGAPRGASPDWPGLPAVEAAARVRIAEVWGVDPADLVLDFGRVRSEWIPGADLRVELRGTGRVGYWIVAASDRRDALSLRVRAGRRVIRPTAAAELPRGHRVREADIALRPVVVWGVEDSGPLADPVGWEVKRRIAEGEVLASPAVSPTAAVVTGAPIEVELRTGAVSVTLAGIALGTAVRGQSLYVRTVTGERLRGEAIGPGRVVVHLAGRG